MYKEAAPYIDAPTFLLHCGLGVLGIAGATLLSPNIHPSTHI